MPRSPAGIEAYNDVRLLWQTVLQNNGLQIQCSSITKTYQLIQRMHMFRTLDRKNTFEGTYSIFDNYIIRHPNKQTTIIIERRDTLNDIVVTTPDGQPTDLEEAKLQIQIDDELKSKPDAVFNHGGFDPDAPLKIETS